LDVLRFVRRFRKYYGYSPTLQDIAKELRIGKLTALEHVQGLETAGLVVTSAHRSRSIRITEAGEALLQRAAGTSNVTANTRILAEYVLAECIALERHGHVVDPIKLRETAERLANDLRNG